MNTPPELANRRFISRAAMPASEQVLELLPDALISVSDVLDVIGQVVTSDPLLCELQPRVFAIYREINDVSKKVSN